MIITNSEIKKYHMAQIKNFPNKSKMLITTQEMVGTTTKKPKKILII